MLPVLLAALEYFSGMHLTGRRPLNLRPGYGAWMPPTPSSTTMPFLHWGSLKNSNFQSTRSVIKMQESLNDIEQVYDELEILTGHELAFLKGGWTELREALAVWVNDLIQQDLNELIRLLYRIDISESRLKFLLHEKVGEDAAFIIADLIIERQLQKIKSRQQFRQPPPDNEEERW